MTYTQTYTVVPTAKTDTAPSRPFTVHAQRTYTETYTAYMRLDLHATHPL